MKTITGKTNVWLYDWKDIEELQVLKDDEAVGYVAYSQSDMTPNNWLLIGTAVVTITLDSKEVTHKTELDVLRKQLAEARTKAQETENLILDRMTKLHALTF